jgi:hypothetical protein
VTRAVRRRPGQRSRSSRRGSYPSKGSPRQQPYRITAALSLLPSSVALPARVHDRRLRRDAGWARTFARRRSAARGRPHRGEVRRRTDAPGDDAPIYPKADPHVIMRNRRAPRCSPACVGLPLTGRTGSRIARSDRRPPEGRRCSLGDTLAHSPKWVLESPGWSWARAVTPGEPGTVPAHSRWGRLHLPRRP